MICQSLRYEKKSIDELAGEAASGHLYAILDPCGSERILQKVLALGPKRCCCLYGPSALEDYWAVAPYLAAADASLLHWLTTEVWDEPWGILVCSACNEEVLLSHLRQLLLIEDPDGDSLYFRYYDPRVLEMFLPTCTEHQLAAMFGPLTHFLITDPEPGTMRVVSFSTC